MDFAYDHTRTLSYGSWECEKCGTSFSGSGEAIHSKDCPARDKGYEPCTYTFGPKEVEAAKIVAERRQDDNVTTSLGPLSLRVLKEHFPELV